MNAFRRPAFAADGRIVARRELTLSGQVYPVGKELSAEHRAELTARQIGAWWQQGLIDTLPAVAPSAKYQHQHRR